MRFALDTIKSVINRLPTVEGFKPVPAPPYEYRYGGIKVGLAVESMKRHMTDEGWQLFAGLWDNGYQLCGHELPHPYTDVAQILQFLDPTVLVLQDKREWDVAQRDFREARAKFTNVGLLKARNDIFKLTVLKDAQQRPGYHRDSAEEIGAHAWITYYATPIVRHVAPYVRQQHCIRTYHTLDAACVPVYTPVGRAGCLLSGAVSGAYPLRSNLFRNVSKLPETTMLQHPGYHRNGSATPGFLNLLSKYKVAICTASMYGYALRKIIEATACGCAVITNLPLDEILPEIDNNLIRVPSTITVAHMAEVIKKALHDYDPRKQRYYADAAISRYDYRNETKRVADEIDALRSDYP